MKLGHTGRPEILFWGGRGGEGRGGVGVNHLIQRYLTAFGGKIWARHGRWAEET